MRDTEKYSISIFTLFENSQSGPLSLTVQHSAVYSFEKHFLNSWYWSENVLSRLCTDLNLKRVRRQININQRNSHKQTTHQVSSANSCVVGTRFPFLFEGVLLCFWTRNSCSFPDRDTNIHSITAIEPNSEFLSIPCSVRASGSTHNQLI